MGEIIYPIIILLLLVTLIIFRIYDVQFDFDEEHLYIWYTKNKKREYKQFKF